MKKIKLPLNTVRDFLNICKSIQSNTDIMPILGYIKISIDFGVCTLTKTSNDKFVTHTFPTPELEDFEFLILESKLSSFCDLSKNHLEIIIEKGAFLGDKITISDGFKLKPSFNNGTYKLEEFPKLPSTFGEAIPIDNDIIKLLKICKNTISEDTLRPMFCAAYVESEYVYSTAVTSVFIKKHGKKFQTQIAIPAKECDLLSQFINVEYLQNDNYNIYKSGNTCYGFILNQGYSGFDFRSYFLNRVSKKDYFTISKEDIMSFCNSTCKFTKSKILMCEVTKSGNIVKFEWNDRDLGENNTMEFDCIDKGGEDFSFGFNINDMLNTVSLLPFNKISLSNEQGNFIGVFTSDDETYSGVISKVQI